MKLASCVYVREMRIIPVSGVEELFNFMRNYFT
ncbi:hypothetical protein V6Z12_A04G115200 [Gossypium hirsutum]